MVAGFLDSDDEFFLEPDFRRVSNSSDNGSACFNPELYRTGATLEHDWRTSGTANFPDPITGLPA